MKPKKSKDSVKNYGGNITSDKYRSAGRVTKNKTNYVLKKGKTSAPTNAKGTTVRSSVKITTGKIGTESAGNVTGNQKVRTNREGTKSRTVTTANLGGKKVKQVAKENYKTGTASVRMRSKKV